MMAQRALNDILNLLFPPRCVGCGRPGSWFCGSCCASVETLAPLVATRTLVPLQGVRAAASLSGPLRTAIHRYKYDGMTVLATPLGKILHQGWSQEPWSVNVIVPVPLHSARLRQRGYNQSALLARQLGLAASLPVDEGSLQRVQATQPQVGLSALQRADNVRNAFACTCQSLKGQVVLLVDDVLTTGATLQACARAVLEGGASGVWAVTLAEG